MPARVSGRYDGDREPTRRGKHGRDFDCCVGLLERPSESATELGFDADRIQPAGVECVKRLLELGYVVPVELV